jgi:hypothetical protein
MQLKSWIKKTDTHTYRRPPLAGLCPPQPVSLLEHALSPSVLLPIGSGFPYVNIPINISYINK